MHAAAMSAFCTSSTFLGNSDVRSSVTRVAAACSRRRPRCGGPVMSAFGVGIGSVAPSGSGAADRREQAARESAVFIDWLTDNGMYLSPKATWGRPMHPLSIADETTDDGEPSGRGLVAMKSLNQGEPLFEVPEELVISRARAIETVPGLPEDTDEYIAIATMLIQERALGDDSFWTPYLDILPKDDEMVPLFRWGDEDMELLSGSPSVAAARSLRAKLRTEFEAMEDALFKLDRDHFPEDVFTVDAWEWAFAVLFSRAIMLQKEGYVALVPYADLLNHSPFCSSYIDMQAEMFTADKYVVLYTDRTYKQMDQVFVTYGPKSNSELLLLYGFVIDRNPYDAVEITVSPDQDDPLYSRKIEYMRKSGITGSATFPLFSDRYPKELIEFLRFCVCTESEFESADFGEFVSEDNESLVAQALTEACSNALKRYPQSLEEDKMVMADLNLYRMLGVKARCAIRQRLGEKRILQRTVNNIAKERAQPTYLFANLGST